MDIKKRIVNLRVASPEFTNGATAETSHEPQMYQRVLIELSDGRKVVFAGAAQMIPGRDEGVLVISTKFEHPKPLPEGYTLEPMGAANTKGDEPAK